MSRHLSVRAEGHLALRFRRSNLVRVLAHFRVRRMISHFAASSVVVNSPGRGATCAVGLLNPSGPAPIRRDGAFENTAVGVHVPDLA